MTGASRQQLSFDTIRQHKQLVADRYLEQDVERVHRIMSVTADKPPGTM